MDQGNSGDEQLAVKFFYKIVPDKEKTLEEGRPISKEVVFCSKRAPGQRDGHCDKANEIDIRRFPRHYQAFLDRVDQEPVSGLVLEDWPGVTRSQCEDLKYFNVRTLEDLVNMSDTNAQNFMGINSLKAKAKLYLEHSKDNAAVEALEKAKKRNDELEKKVADMEAKMNAFMEMQDKPKKRHRRTKAQIEADMAGE